MRAAVVKSFDQPLEIEDVPVPEPGSEQVLIRMEAFAPEPRLVFRLGAEAEVPAAVATSA